MEELSKVKPKAALTIRQIEERLRALPDVSAVSVTGMGVLANCNKRPMSAEGPPKYQDIGAFGLLRAGQSRLLPDAGNPDARRAGLHLLGLSQLTAGRRSSARAWHSAFSQARTRLVR